MSNYAEIRTAALALPPDQRTELADVLLASTDRSGGAPEISDAWQRELVRRSAEVAAGTASYTTYEQMRGRARRAAGHDD